MEFSFKNKIWTAGNSNVVTVPKVFADLLDKEREYKFVIQKIEEVEEDEE